MMQAPDSAVRSFLSVNIPKDALPVPILVILLIGFFGLVGLAVFRAKDFKEFAKDFPGQKATVIFGLAGFTGIVIIGMCRLALGMAYPDGYGDTHWIIAGCLGFGAAAGIGKHAFSTEREEVKARAAVAVAAATPPQPTQVLAAQGSSVNVNTEATAERPVPIARPPKTRTADIEGEGD